MERTIFSTFTQRKVFIAGENGDGSGFTWRRRSPICFSCCHQAMWCGAARWGTDNG